MERQRETLELGNPASGEQRGTQGHAGVEGNGVDPIADHGPNPDKAHAMGDEGPQISLRGLRNPTEWLRLEAPDLRIVSAALWEAAHARLDHNRTLYARTANGRLLDRPTHLDYTGDSPYLLSGLARCAACGGSLVALTRGQNAPRTFFYGCAYHHQRGKTVCRNALLIRQTILDHAVLDALAAALDDRLIARAVDVALARLRSGREQALDRRAQIERELSLIEAKIPHLGESFTTGRATDTLLGLLEDEGARKKALTRELSGLHDTAKVASLDAGRLTKAVAATVADVRGLLGQHIPQARQMLRKLVNGRLACTPYEENGRKGYRFTGRVTYRRLLPTDLQATVVAPTGFEPVFQSRHVFANSYGNLRCTHPVEMTRDSNTHGVPPLGGRSGIEDRAAGRSLTARASFWSTLAQLPQLR